MAVKLINKSKDLLEKGDVTAALEVLRRGQEENPDNVEVLLALGETYNNQGDYKNAVTALQRACHLEPRNPDILVPYSRALAEIGAFKDALMLADFSVRSQPDSILALENAGKVFSRAGNIPGAIGFVERLTAQGPEEKKYFSELSRLYEMNRQYEEAYKTFLKVWDEDTGALKDESIATAVDFARAGEYAYHARQTGQAIANFEKSLALEANDPHAWCFIGRCHSSAGDSEAARKAFEKAIEVNPHYIPAYYYLSGARGFEEGDPAFATLEKLKELETLGVADKAALGFALGRMYQGIEDYDKAFENFSLGNACSRQQSISYGYAFDRAAHQRSLELIAALYAPKNRKKLEYKGSKDAKPVFIIGMQRSGTTLLEQILTAHSEISSAGELTYLAINHRDLMIRTGKLRGAAREAALLAALDEEAETYAQAFLKVLDKKGEGTALVIDKLPQNFMQLGLIGVLFPNARVIHIKRDPMDVGLSIYCSQFSADLSFAQDLSDIGFYISRYRDLMADWERVLDLPIHEVDYEALVDEPEKISRGVIEFCGLEWQPECLEFYKNPGKVFTASVMQVRKPVNKSAVGKWKRYEKHLGPLREALEE